MTLTKLEISNPAGDILSLPIADYSNGYLINDVEGLGPVKATLTSSSMAQVDGAQPQSSRRDIRNITFKVELKPNYVDTSIDGLRSALYDYFLPKAVVGINLYRDGILWGVTTGTVESFDNPMFTQKAEMNGSIVCADPDFYGPSVVSVSGSTVSTSTTQTITYPGTIEAGIIFTLNVNRTIAGFSLYNTKPDGTSQIFNVTVPFVNGDVVVIKSIPRQKSIILTHSGTPVSVLYGVDPSSSWISLAKGNNSFRAAVSGAAIPYTVQYTPKYGAF